MKQIYGYTDSEQVGGEWGKARYVGFGYKTEIAKAIHTVLGGRVTIKYIMQRLEETKTEYEVHHAQVNDGKVVKFDSNRKIVGRYDISKGPKHKGGGLAMVTTRVRPKAEQEAIRRLREARARREWLVIKRGDFGFRIYNKAEKDYVKNRKGLVRWFKTEESAAEFRTKYKAKIRERIKRRGHGTSTKDKRVSVKAPSLTMGVGIGFTPYFRPDVQSISYKEVDENREFYLTKAGFKKISNTVWATDPMPMRWPAKRGNYSRQIVIRDANKYRFFRVPCDRNGMISDRLMAERLLDIHDGDREGSVRNVFIDLLIDSDKKCDAKDLAKLYRWWLYPNESDVRKIDDANSILVQILDKRDRPSGPRGLVITGGTPEQRQELADAVKQNFTIAEKKLLAGCIIEVRKLPRGIAGLYERMGGHGISRISVSPNHTGKEHDVVVHEAIHALRDKDEKREGPMKAPSLYIGRDRDLEESLTEAESVARQRPFTKHTSGAGYYQYLAVPDPTSKYGAILGQADVIKEDRITVTDPKAPKKWDEAPKKGKRALNAVIKRFPRMNISKLKLAGDVEAIDSFFKVNRVTPEGTMQVIHVQAYQPKNPSAERIRGIIKIRGHRVIEWRDGKAHTIKDAAPPKIKRSGPKRILLQSGSATRQRRGVLIKS